MEEDDNCPQFNNSEEEAKYWKSKANEYRKKLQESQAELEEYQSHSSELETELETELEQQTAKCSELRHQVSKLATENESLKERLASQSAALEKRVDSLESELQCFRSKSEQLTVYIRQLEQSNDDLERAKRATLTSLEDFEQKLNQAIERNVFLENELDEKESLKETIQRLRDESRDLRHEVMIREQQEALLNGTNSLGDSGAPPAASLPSEEHHQPDNDRAAAAAGAAVASDGGVVDSNRLAEEEYRASSPQMTQGVTNGNSPLTPSARVSALNIVGDLLRKVGALETRLASCRTLVKDNQRPMTNTTASNPSAR